jgi:glutamine amidotransferase-like uncharacterized protein
MTSAVLRLTTFGWAVLSMATGAVWAAVESAQPSIVRVAICDDTEETEKRQANLLRILTTAAGFAARPITSEQIRQGELSEFDVLIMPGGSGSKQAERLQEAGRDRIREFVRSGGGYVGICAGSYLASSHYSWSLGLINARVWDRAHWARGDGTVSIRMTDAGWQLLGRGGSIPVQYNQGPLLVPDDESDLPGYEILATFETEVASKGAQPGSMTGTHAIIRSMFGQGRVICFSPHPEAAGGPNGIVAYGVLWAGQGQQGRPGRDHHAPQPTPQRPEPTRVD